MNTNDIKRLALVLAIQSEIEGMKASNIKASNGGGSPIYSNNSFSEKASDLRVLARCKDEELSNYDGSAQINSF